MLEPRLIARISEFDPINRSAGSLVRVIAKSCRSSRCVRVHTKDGVVKCYVNMAAQGARESCCCWGPETHFSRYSRSPIMFSRHSAQTTRLLYSYRKEEMALYYSSSAKNAFNGRETPRTFFPLLLAATRAYTHRKSVSFGAYCRQSCPLWATTGAAA